MGEFPSKEVKDGDEVIQNEPDSPYTFATAHDDFTQESTDPNTIRSKLQSILNHAKECTSTLFKICRRKASEVNVWLLQDTDREWNAERPHSIPIAYALKGYSLSVEVMRSMCEDVL